MRHLCFNHFILLTGKQAQQNGRPSHLCHGQVHLQTWPQKVQGHERRDSRCRRECFATTTMSSSIENNVNSRLYLSSLCFADQVGKHQSRHRPTPHRAPVGWQRPCPLRLRRKSARTARSAVSYFNKVSKYQVVLTCRCSIVSFLSTRFRCRYHKRDLQVRVADNLECCLGDKRRQVTVEQSASGPTFKKNGGNALVLLWPAPSVNGH